MVKTFKPEMDLCKLMARFGAEDKCREYLADLRWPDGRVCIRCGVTKGISYVQTRAQYECESCGYHFSVTAGTAMHDTHLPLSKWLLTTFIMCESKKGVSAKQIQRMLNVSYKTAWHLCHRIRHAMASTVELPLSGIVEVDETWIGGERRGKGYVGNKTMVLGAVERGGSIRLKVDTRANRRTLRQFINKHVSPTDATIITDSHAGYINATDDRPHYSVNHEKSEWVRGQVHTQTVESVWSLFKRSVVGSYHQLSAKHLPAYLDEMEWRFNGRDNRHLFRDTCMALLKAEALPLKKLVEKAA